MEYDVAIIGGGPAGFTAGIYSGRAGLKTVILEKTAPGGQVALTNIIENYPGFPGGIEGPDLMAKFMQQAMDFQVELEMGPVLGLDTSPEGLEIKTDSGTYAVKAAVVATGADARALGVPGEERFMGRGLSYCAICDAAFFRDKKVAVVGGGDSAVEEAIFLTNFAGEVHVIHRRDALRASPLLQERLFANDKIKMRWNSVVEGMDGQDTIESLTLRDVKTDEKSREDFDGIFVFIGRVPNTDFLGGKIHTSGGGYIITDEALSTSMPGVYAAGDVREKSLRQVATAVGDGAAAAVSVERYLASK